MSFRSVTVALFALAASAVAQTSVAPAKVAIINAQKSVVDTAEIKKASATLEAKYKSRQDQLQQLQKDLQNIQQQLNAPGIAADRQAQLQAEGTAKQKQAQRISEDLQADVNADRQDILGRAGRQMTEVVRKLAEQRGYDVVIDVSNTLYYRPALDITADATAAYDKAYPAQ